MAQDWLTAISLFFPSKKPLTQSHSKSGSEAPLGLPCLILYNEPWLRCKHPLSELGSLCHRHLSPCWVSVLPWWGRLPSGRLQIAVHSKNLPAMQETWVWFLDREAPLEKEMATPSSILAWRISWTEEPCGLQAMGSQESDMTEWLSLLLLLLLQWRS